MPRYILVAGVDFGTSFTKVVIRNNNAPGSNAVVVCFPEHKDGLLPSLVGFQGGCLAVRPSSKDLTQIPYLKMMAAGVAEGKRLDQVIKSIPHEIQAIQAIQSDSIIVRNLLAFYFAYVISATEEFIRTSSPWRDFDFKPGSKEDFLIYQLAVPAGLINDNRASERLFREAFIAGYELRSAPPAPHSWKDKILSVFGRQKSNDDTPGKPESYTEWSQSVNRVFAADQRDLDARYEWQCLIYPEVAAAVQTIFRAPNAQDDLYITMDVGAGTVDLNAFRRFSGFGDRAIHQLDYYSAIVRPLGVHHLTDPKRIATPISKKKLQESLRQAMLDIFRRACVKQPNHGSIQGRRTWDGSKIYIFGGGSHHSIYRSTFVAGLSDAGIHEPHILNLYRAQDISLPNGVEFGRFAVAYGLSFFRANLDEVVLPQELPNFHDLYPLRPPRQYGFNWED